MYHALHVERARLRQFPPPLQRPHQSLLGNPPHRRIRPQRVYHALRLERESQLFPPPLHASPDGVHEHPEQVVLCAHSVGVLFECRDVLGHFLREHQPPSVAIF